jgi:hypothetical protein
MVQRKASPYSGFNFTVELGDGVVGGFEEIDGLGTPDNVAPARVPGLHKHTKSKLEARYSRSTLAGKKISPLLRQNLLGNLT